MNKKEQTKFYAQFVDCDPPEAPQPFRTMRSYTPSNSVDERGFIQGKALINRNLQDEMTAATRAIYFDLKGVRK